MMKLDRKSLPAPRIEMLPLIDIVFLLLVFFIYAMLSMAVHHGQPVDLPVSGAATLETDEAIAVTIQAGSQAPLLFVDEHEVSLDQLAEKLEKKKAAQQSSEQCEVQIFADKGISYQELFKVLDRVQQAGISRISLQAEGSSP